MSSRQKGSAVKRRHSQAGSFANLVNTLQGTDSHHGFSTGNTLPLVVTPHGMTAWTPQTGEGRWAFQHRAHKIHGFRATHQPSPWMADYGQFLVMASAGESAPTSVADAESPYRKSSTVALPHYFRTELLRFGIEAEITPTERGACLRFTFPKGANTWIAFKLAEGRSITIDRRRVHGTSTANQGGVPSNFGCHFVAEFDTDILDSDRFTAAVTSPDHEGEASGAWVRLARPAGGRVVVRIATSFISRAQALRNLRAELSGRTFSSLRDAACRTWDRRLGVIEIEGATQAQRRTFYSCLYRCFQFPRKWHETSASGAIVHFSPFDGKVHAGPLYSDAGFWDIYRALLPLLTIIDPDLVNEMIEGWLNAFREGGWLPSWSCPGYRDCMVGSHLPVIIADAWLKGIQGFDTRAATAAILRDATRPSKDAACGRLGLAEYMKRGYIPSDRLKHSVARTTDYAHGDFGAAQFLAAMGSAARAKALRTRALNYRNVFDPKKGFFRGRMADGSWREPFREFEWSADFIEGSAWQHRWAAPHDVSGLIKLMGGPRRFVARLDRMLALPPRFETGHYDREIHEMTEMAATHFGQYAHSNEPVHHALYLYSFAKRPDQTQYWVRRIIDELYTPTIFPGDEDNGAMSSWFILGSLGIYQVAVGEPEFVLGTPRFRRATIHLPGGRDFVVEAKGPVATTPFVSSVTLNGRPHDSLSITHRSIASGGVLSFTMTPDRALAAKRGMLTPPFSLSTSPSAPPVKVNGHSLPVAARKLPIRPSSKTPQIAST